MCEIIAVILSIVLDNVSGTVSNFNLPVCVLTTKSAIKLYNEIRLHLSLDFKKPNMVCKLSV